MKRHYVFSVFLSFLLIFSSVALAQKSKGTDYDALAQKIVGKCANIKEGQSVLITGSPRDLTLLENLAADVRKAGAFPLLSITTDRLDRKMYDDVPEKYDSQVNVYSKNVINATDAMIAINTREKEGLLADIPTARMAARSKAAEEMNQLMVKKNMIGVGLGNGMYPTADRAKEFGISQQQLATIFWAGVNTDYDKLQSRGEKMTKMLSSAKEVQITTPAGTNLTVKIEGRTPHVSDGVISDADLKAGYASSNVYLPAGEVFVAPVPRTAQGKVVVEKTFYQGKEIKKLALEIKDGKVTSMTAQSGLEPLKKFYDAMGGRKDELSFIDIGINPDVKIPAGSSMTTWVPAGMITVGLGDNTWAGGDNTTPFSLPLFLMNATVKLDNTVLIDNGKLNVEDNVSSTITK